MKYDIKQDHTDIKQQIKEWELRIDYIIGRLSATDVKTEIIDDLEQITNEMMSINI